MKIHAVRGRYPLDFTLPWHSRSDGFLQYAEVYKTSIELIMQKYSAASPSHDYSLAPVLFLLRQYVELQLKGIIIFCKKDFPETDKHHNINRLYRNAITALKDEFEEVGKADREVEDFIMALGNFDPMGDIFRYPENRNGEAFSERIKKTHSWLYERMTNLSQLSALINKIIGDLEGAEEMMNEYDNLKRENENENSDEM